MAGSPVSQCDDDPPEHPTTFAIENAFAVQPPRRSSTPLSHAFEQVSGFVRIDDPTSSLPVQGETVSKFFAALTRSGTGSQHSYDLLKDDDYDLVPNTPTASRLLNEHRLDDVPQPIRTASVGRRLPLNHPRPDLQAIQGAYVRNVERLEEHAERLSMTSNMDESLREMELDPLGQPEDWFASISGYAPILPEERTGSSPPGTMVHVASGEKLDESYSATPLSPSKRISYRPTSFVTGQDPQDSSPRQEGPLLADLGSRFSPIADLGLGPALLHSRTPSNTSDAARPGSAGSGDTFQQANTLFRDFDGVHYDADRNQPRRINLQKPPRARDSQAFREPQPGEEMIFYPAPIPVMLNLPMRLSKANWSQREKRRLQALSTIPDEMRGAAPWLGQEHTEGLDKLAKRQTGLGSNPLPAHLRASAFFDHVGLEQNLQLKEGSAVKTLDDILDAAARAPVSAFTDHPIAGHLGEEVYGASQPRKSLQISTKIPKRKSSLGTVLSGAESSAAVARKSQLRPAGFRDAEPETPLTAEDDEHVQKSIAPTADELPDDELEDVDITSQPSEATYRPGFNAAPTTLLAELQMRKAQQKQRNRTAADAFPRGMHSTLLELDAVAQLQQRARKQKHVTLAWEDHEAADKENYEDEDVPLGMLYPENEKEQHANIHRPLGLMERKELEENEPLSSRRARLRGEPLAPPPESSGVQSQNDTAPVIDLPQVDGQGDTDDEEESLAQRKQRMRERKERTISKDFAREIQSDLGLPGNEPPTCKPATPDPGETLGQRRRRLQAEAQKNGGDVSHGPGRPSLGRQRSLGDLLMHNPVGYQDPKSKMTTNTALQSYQIQQGLAQNPSGINAIPLHLAGATPLYTPTLGYTTNPRGSALYGNMMVAPFGGQGVIPNVRMMNANMMASVGMGAGLGASHIGYPYNGMNTYASDTIGMGPPLSAKQRSTIDSWRQGVL